jgi:ABC-type antimicrobial peptide transport system permease subunit
MVQIVGVAKQSKYFGLVEPAVDYLYLPLAQQPRTAMSLVLHTAVPPGDLAAPLRSLVVSLDSGQPMIGLRTMDEIFDVRGRQMLDVLIQTIGGLGLVGLVLALVGLYGLMTYSVGLRQREIGIRMAIGADRSGVVQMVLKQGLALAGSGIAIGVLLWVLASKPILAFLEAHSFSWVLLALVAAGLLAAAAAGAYIPARRASLIDPNLVLRQE